MQKLMFLTGSVCIFLQASPEIMVPNHALNATALLLSNDLCFTHRKFEDERSFLLQDSNTQVVAQKATEWYVE